MEALINNKYTDYVWWVDFEELPTYIDDAGFLMKCRYKYDDYPTKLVQKYKIVKLEV